MTCNIFVISDTDRALGSWNQMVCMLLREFIWSLLLDRRCPKIMERLTEPHGVGCYTDYKSAQEDQGCELCFG